MLLQYIVPQYMGCHRSGTYCACHRAIQALTTSLGSMPIIASCFPTNIGYCQCPKNDHSQTFPSSTLGHYLQLYPPALLQRTLLLRRRPTPSLLVQCPLCLTDHSNRCHSSLSVTLSCLLWSRYPNFVHFYIIFTNHYRSQHESTHLWRPDCRPVPAASKSMHVEEQCRPHDILGQDQCCHSR
jgi:hypothetical protein